MMSMMVGPGVLVHNSRLGIEMVRATFSAVRTGELVIGAGGGGLMEVPVLTTIGWMEALSAQLLALTVNMKESFPVKLRLGTKVTLGKLEERFVMIRVPWAGLAL